MTYKKTQTSLDHINRVASAATRPSARGLIRDIPRWAQAPEDYFNSLQEQHAIKAEQVKNARERVDLLRKQKQSRPELQHKYDIALGDLGGREREMTHLRALVHAASANAWGTMFYLCCKQLLDQELFAKIEQDVRDMLQRERKPLAKTDIVDRKIVKNRIRTLKRDLEVQKRINQKLRERV